MARLTIEQVRAPDLTGTSQIIANAGQAFQTGLESAEGILGKYQEGRQKNADQDILAQVAGIKSEDELAAFLASDAISKSPLSNDMQNTILGLRDSVLGQNQQRADTAQTRSSTAISQAAEGRTSALYQDAVNVRDATRGLTGQILAAQAEGEQYGYSGPTPSFSAAINATESGGANDQYDTLFGHRNRQNGVRVSQMTLGDVKAFSDTSGEYGQSVNAEIGRVATPMGKYQIVGTTLREIQQDLSLPDTVQFNPAVQELMGTYLGQRRVQNGGSIESMRSGLRSEWEGFKNKSDAELDVIIGELRNTPTVSRDQIIAASSGGNAQAQGPVTQNAPRSGADAALREALSSNPYLDYNAANDILASVGAAQVRGQERINGAENARVQNIGDEAILGGILNPETTSQTDLQRGLIANGQSNGLTAAQILDQTSRGAGAAEAFGNILSPNVETPFGVNSSVDQSQAQGLRSIEAMPQTRMYETADSAGSNPVASLEGITGLNSDGQGEYKTREVQNYISEFTTVDGQQFTEGEVVAAMNEVFQLDPGDDDASSFWVNSDITPNTLSRRFPQAELERVLKENFSPEARNRYNGEVERIRGKDAELQTSRAELNQLQIQAAKYPAGQVPQTLQQQIEQKSRELVNGSTQREATEALNSYMLQSGMSSRLNNLPRDSVEYERAVMQMEETIRTDNRLPEAQKTLLIRALSG